MAERRPGGEALVEEARRRSHQGPRYRPAVRESAKSVIQVKTETQKGTGDKVTFGLRMQLSGNGFTSSDRAEGNGEQLTTNSDAITIDELGNVVGIRSKNTIDAQRVPFNLRDELTTAGRRSSSAPP